MKTLFIYYTSLAVISILLVLDMIWASIIPFEITSKLLVTIAIIGGGSLVIQLIYQEIVADKKDRSDKFTD